MNERLPRCILGRQGRARRNRGKGGRDADRTGKSVGRVGCCARDSGWAWFGEGAE
jgi:hypothetical protein